MRDLRDPTAIGDLLLGSRVRVGTAAQNGSILAAADELPRFLIPQTRGDESPLERYGDPRTYDVEVETTIRRVPVMPIERLAG
jgi:hypothetical protein